MNALFGYFLFNKSTGYDDKSREFAAKTMASFPSRFTASKKIEEPGFCVAGSFDSVRSGQEESAESSMLFYNGEIYNRKEIENYLGLPPAKFETDAALLNELILRNRLEAVRMVNGQFIIIYLDRAKDQIHFINDHIGIRQLYYHKGENIFLFGTEMKFLLGHPEAPKNIDWESSLSRPDPCVALSSYKSYTAWFKDILLLPESSILSVERRSRQISIAHYWSLNGEKAHDYDDDTRTAEDVMEGYIDLLDNAIKIRLKDEPVSYSLLSGGLDSSAICALAARHSPLETYSIITRTTFLEGTTDICRNLAADQHFKNAQYLVPMHQISFNADLWKQWIWRIESPVNHNDSLTKTMLHLAIKQNHPEVKAVFTGTGSDQLNGGLVRWIANDVGDGDENWENFQREIQDVENRMLVGRSEEELWNLRNYVNRDFLTMHSGKKVEANSWMFYVDRALHSQLYSLTWDEVRASNFYGHETRFPFLDFRFVEFVRAIPPRLHKDLFYDKTILRIPIKKYLPDYVINKPKAPAADSAYDFRIELYKFLTKKNGISIVDEALGDIDQPHPVINKKELLKQIKKMQQEPEIFGWLKIMRILNLCLLEKLPGKTEMDMNIEALVVAPVIVPFDNAVDTKSFLINRLSIKREEIDLQNPLTFTVGCSLLTDKMNNKLFLSKENELAFEIEEAFPDWKNFLLKIDNKRSVQQILDELQIPYNSIEEFLKMAEGDNILTTQGTNN